MAKALVDRRRTGIEPRHTRSCAAKGWDEIGICNCTPTFQAAVFVARDGKTIRKTFPTLTAAERWRADARQSVRKGTLTGPTRQTVDEAFDAMLAGMQNGSVRNRNRRPFKPRDPFLPGCHRVASALSLWRAQAHRPAPQHRAGFR
jgi:hypothetical protein